MGGGRRGLERSCFDWDSKARRASLVEYVLMLKTCAALPSSPMIISTSARNGSLFLLLCGLERVVVVLRIMCISGSERNPTIALNHRLEMEL